LAKFFDIGPPNFEELTKNKGMEVTVWTLTSPFMSAPECRKYPDIKQIQGELYQRFYNKTDPDSFPARLYNWDFVFGLWQRSLALSRLSL